MHSLRNWALSEKTICLYVSVISMRGKFKILALSELIMAQVRRFVLVRLQSEIYVFERMKSESAV